jgi:hypothetical protein
MSGTFPLLLLIIFFKFICLFQKLIIFVIDKVPVTTGHPFGTLREAKKKAGKTGTNHRADGLADSPFPFLRLSFNNRAKVCKNNLLFMLLV